MTARIFVFCIAAGFASAAGAYYSGDASGGRPGDYLLVLSGDAAQAARGGSGSALRGNLAGVYLNPASLCDLERDELSFFYRPMFDGGNYYFIGGGHKFGPVTFLPKSSYMGVSFAGVESAMAEKTSLLRESIGSFDAKEQSFIFSFAYPVKDKLAAGTNIKLLSQSMDTYRASSVGADLGIISSWKYADVSFCVQNFISPSLKLKDSADDYSSNLIFGAAGELPGGKIKPSLDLIRPGAGSGTLWKAGCSYMISPVFALAAGLNYKELSAGFAVTTERCSVDYALVFHELGIKHMLSVTFYFDTDAAEEAKLYYSSRKELERRGDELRKAKQVYDKLTNTAIEYFLNDKYELARAEFREIAMIESDTAEDLEALFNIEMKIEEKAQKQKSRDLFTAAREQLRKSDFDTCLKTVDEILNLDPANKSAALLQSRCLAYKALNKGEYLEAKKFLEDALKLSPADTGVLKLLQRLRKFLGEHGAGEDPK
ncbi:MAG: hypothetical protein CVU78_04585 [Elusimicrobia bacterium HGW-Elusimicrobia-2]|nr:MAG: hypothetical protein CVU78_04585 [Elusimicrobia bacterium HGW-Elusimicrobia-2]